MVSIISHGAEGFAEPVQFKAHSDGVTAVSWGQPMYPSLLQNPGSENPPLSPLRLATGGCDRTAKVWIQDEINKNFGMEASWSHDDWVRDVAFSNNAGLPYDLLASCSEDKTVHIRKKVAGKWEDPKVLRFIGPVWRVSWSLAGNMLAVAAADNVVYVYEEKETGKWEPVSEMSEAKSEQQ